MGDSIKNENNENYLRLIHDSKANTSPERSFSTESPEISYDSGTTFSNAIKGKKVDEVLEVFEELMATLQAINPRLYESVMRKL